MTLSRYFLGLLLLGVAVVPLQSASTLWRARLIGSWNGAPARLAEIIADLAVVTVVMEVLGALHVLRAAPVVASLAVIGLAGVWAARRHDRTHAPPEASVESPGAAPLAANVVALVATSVVVAEWGTRIVQAYHLGMIGVDTMWYHMPFAARFAQTGNITALHYVDSQPVTVFFPATSELFHALGIELLGNDVLSPILNVAWLGLALLAAWCIGRPWRLGPVTLTGSCALFATPGLVATQPGGAYDDVVGLALLLAAAALLVNAQALQGRPQRVAWALAAASMGIAVGTKFTFLGTAGALTLGVWFLAPRAKRISAMALWLGFLFLTGIFWYARNLFAVGNPLPSLHLTVGPISLPSPPVATPTSTVSHFLFNWADWRGFFIPGMRASFGPAWWALLGLSAAGLVLAVLKGDRLLRVFGAVGLVSALVFVFTPQFLAVGNAPVYFQENVRYADAAVILGLVLLPVNPLLARWARARWILIGYAGILLAVQFDATIWPTSLLGGAFAQPVRGRDLLVGILIGVGFLILGAGVVAFKRQASGRGLPALAWVLAGLLVVLIGFPVQQAYLRDRYSGDLFLLGFPVRGPEVKEPVRIALAGNLSFLQYPSYGKTSANYVQYLGVPGPHGAYSLFRSCAQWRSALIEGGYQYVAITTGVVSRETGVDSLTPTLMKWTRGHGVHVVQQGVLTWEGTGHFGYGVYRIDHGFRVSGCATSA